MASTTVSPQVQVEINDDQVVITNADGAYTYEVSPAPDPQEVVNTFSPIVNTVLYELPARSCGLDGWPLDM